ncbi:MAG: type II toxin-antitoxin system prevent-host-death family antitoxin [Thermoguttaceae bacterium]
MQTTIGVYEAKTHFAALLKRVEHGEQFLIRRHGTPVAILAPPTRTEAERARIRKAIDGIIELRRGLKLDGLSIREAINEGRR